MKGRKRIIVVAVAVTAACLAGGGAAIASGFGINEDDTADTPITGAALDQAIAAALAATGGGSVTGTEVGDEESYYEVEVTLKNGHQVDVQLDKQFAVVEQEGDSEHESGDNPD
ncbi:MAG TPA: PepSY domain-containing protein [Homoserinimonas sp.]|nr:PepSY domain-containing protein [Homoserinimonas sp.]